MLLFLLAACCFGSPAAVESFVAVPDTVEAANALNAPPDVTVVVTRVTRETGGGNCGHSAVCLIVLPILLWEAVFPPQVDSIVITEGGKQTVTGEWEVDGDLIWAERREGNTVKAARLLNLEHLGRRIVIVGGTAQVDAGGVTGPFTPVTVQSQVDLLAAYEKELSTTSNTHASLLNEELGALGVEAMPAVAARLSNPAEEEDARAAVLQNVCSGSDPQGDALLLRRTLVQAASKASQPEDARLGLECALGDAAPNATTVRAFLGVLTNDICTQMNTDSLDAMRQVHSNYPVVGTIAADLVQACPAVARRVLLRNALGLGNAELSDAMLVEDNAVYYIIQGLNPDRADERAAIFSRLGHTEPETNIIVERLELSEAPFSVEEGGIIAGAYLREKPGLLGGRQPQGRLLSQLANVLPPTASAATSVLNTAFTAADEKQRPVAAAGLLVLGKRNRAVDTAKGMGSTANYEPSAGGIIGIDQLTAWAMVTAGCAPEELEGARAKAAGLPSGADDPLCTKP